MASFTAGTTFADGVANDVTAAKLGVLVTNATPTSGFIQDRTAETVIASNDTVLIGDASDSNNLKRMTVDNLMKAEMTGNINSTSGTIQTLTSSTATITSGTIGGLFNGSLNTTSGTIGTFNSTTATIPTLTSTTLITSGTGTASAPAIVPTGDTNNGLFFPAADNIAVSTNGTERVRVDSSGRVGIGTSSPASPLHVYGANGSTGEIRFQSSDGRAFIIGATGTGYGSANNLIIYDATASTERLRIDSSGNVGVGTSSPSYRMSVDTSAQQILSCNSTDANGGYATFLRSGTVKGFIGSAQPLVSGGSNNDFAIRAENNLVFATNTNTERLRIGSSGQIGIGGENYGTSGQVLTSNGTGSAPSWQTSTIADASITPAKLSQPPTTATAVNSTSGTAIDFTGIPSWAKRILVIFSGVSTNGASVVQIRIGTTSGIVSSGYSGSSGGSTFTSGFNVGDAGGAGVVRHGLIELVNVTSNTWVASGGIARSDAASSNQTAGSLALSGQLTQIRITASNTTDAFDAGIINIMYMG